ncbi:MAG TPA: NAD-dependent epimerase/dehydratase family protein [Phycisphaerae bacterium]|jgi:nucleoside-diphosphate-sugar epimerase|nr:NAD-dependent epimerase/dehydratase family protein [Phycisphaerae bacterium]HPC22538.1 NAD-dependent epimerase/dehydratase family protein [Phycisphaerae bacterium]HRS27419.1 NAD-dependent epimerase/dehydratase family protein [Phycisphaerae bacterium]HRT42312.1 NAD-dependent epimerase/dehydratase family protein [Phycisphaerae bacterium]
MRVLITGSSGQIGTNVALALLDRGDEVCGIDIRPNPWTKRIPTVLRDLNRPTDDDFGQTGKFDVVLHLAAHAKVFELVETPRRAMENVGMAFGVLEYCRRHRTPLIFGSSREVYGDIHRHVTDESQADFVVAESPYSASKIAGEAFIYSYAQCYKLPHLVFRFSNVYGRYDCDLERLERVIPLFIRRIHQEEPIVVYGREKVLDFTYIDDCVNGVVRAIDLLVAGKVSRETINLAYGQGATLQDLVNIIGLALQKQPKVHYEPSRSGEVTRYVADISKARRLLGYTPQTPLTAGVPLSIEWQRSIGVLKA